ncbi:TetR/AcrR family transcriptional regulator [Paenibacillus oenotherae]|uniref:TetR/AcrR family transcriptional regulator n=1 Tax=Paenibacillus oenotherae TaxID=1435645 RepID=A0ABS7DA80_9BACL|nr:TetR/AcrR family transcriptional regulator [Paenibacillus oenotherae]
MEQSKKTVDRKSLIVEAAAQSFAMFGYKATTMDLVSRIATVGKGTIYTFFDTKEELFGAIMDQLVAELRALAERTLDRSKPFFDNLASILHELLQFREKHELIVKLSQEVRDIGTPMAKEGMERLEGAIIGFIQQEVEHAIEKGELRAVDPALTAFLMLRMYVALAAEWSQRHEPLSREEIADYFVKVMKSGVG